MSPDIPPLLTVCRPQQEVQRRGRNHRWLAETTNQSSAAFIESCTVPMAAYLLDVPVCFMSSKGNHAKASSAGGRYSFLWTELSIKLRENISLFTRLSFMITHSQPLLWASIHSYIWLLLYYPTEMIFPAKCWLALTVIRANYFVCIMQQVVDWLKRFIIRLCRLSSPYSIWIITFFMITS